MSSMNAPRPLDVLALRKVIDEELTRRTRGTEGYAETRDGPAALYGITGAVHCKAALGIPLEDRSNRKNLAARMLAFRDNHGNFIGSDGPGHAVHMVSSALNLLGEPIPEDIGPVAPREAEALAPWLDRLDWTSTHKELCGQTIPLLAGNQVNSDWITVFTDEITARLDPERPLEMWCRADDPPERVISCIYHVLATFDAGRLPYPRPRLILDRLKGLGWEQVGDEVPRTVCTDGDWAWMLLRLSEIFPTEMVWIMDAIRRVSLRRVRTWREDSESILRLSTHHLYCYLWVTAVFQSCTRDHYTGGYIRDTLNDPSLFRL